MNKLEVLKNVTKKSELAELLGVKASFLTHTLYILRPETQYHQFDIPKRNGGKRIINAPSDKLKSLQSSLSILLLDCIDEINKVKYPNPEINKSTLAHGFVRERSIITNAMMHLNQKNVLNIDLDNFFDSFHFGRIRGFFIKNKNFKLHSDIATVIAQISCYNNKLPQGSPCSPVITNLITHSLDIRLASLAKKHSCTYSRYADDITFSTRKSKFPSQIISEEKGVYKTGKRLARAIKNADFSINKNKTRIQYKDSRQDVTGLIVNKKPNTKKEYWRTARSQCHSLFMTGAFTKKTGANKEEGNINELEGQLNFIDQVDLYNRLRQQPPLNPVYALKREQQKHLKHTKHLLTGREKTFSRFLYYRLFYGNPNSTILCEGKTDNIYLKSAISELVTNYPKLASPKTKDKRYDLLIRFVEYSKRTRFFLELFGGTDYLKSFIQNYHKQYEFYKAPNPENPVILVLDNDTGPNGLINYICSKESTNIFPDSLDKKKDCRKADFIHVIHNLYVVLTPLGKNDQYTDIEYFFDDATRLKTYKKKCFNLVGKRDDKTDLSKDSFSQHIIKTQKNTINFDGLKPILDRIVKAMEHYDSIK